MKHITFSIFCLCTILSARAVDIVPPVVETKTQAQFVSENLITGANSALNVRIENFKVMWSMLWENDRATPADILAALGTKAKSLFVAAGLARQDMTSIATVLGTTPEAMLGDAKYLTPKVPVTIHDDGTVTLQQ